MNEETFLKAIIDEPDLDENYLVFADWLDEQGRSARAELIRVRIEADRIWPRSPRHTELEKKYSKLRKQCEASWPGYKKWSPYVTFLCPKGLPTTGRLNGEYSDPNKIPLDLLPDFPWLMTLEHVGVAPSPETFAKLAQRTHVHTLDMSYSATVADADVEPLGKLPSLRGLKLYSEGYLTDAGVRHLLPLKSLQTLDLSWTKITDAGAALLRNFRMLRSICLDKTEVTDAGLAHLAKLRQLRVLRLRRTKLTDRGLKRFAGFTDLTELDVGETQITLKSLDVILGFTKLRFLGMSDIYALNDSNVMRLAALPELVELDLGRTGVTRYRMHRLKQFPKLRYIKLEETLDSRHDREITAFLEDTCDENFFVEIDYE
jgi:uncharacterized protein (TIGR02996 family)